MTSDCQHCLDLLDDYRRGQLGTADMAMVKTHLQQCSECGAELEYRNELAISLRRSLPAVQPAQGISPAVLSAISSAAQSLPQRPKNKLLPWMLSAAAAIIVLIAFMQQRTPEITGDQEIVSLYRQINQAPAGAVKPDSPEHAREAQDTVSAGPASPQLLFDVEPAEHKSKLALADQGELQQEEAAGLKNEYGYAAVPALSRAAQVPSWGEAQASVQAPATAEAQVPVQAPAAAETPVLALRKLGAEGAAGEFKRRASKPENFSYAETASVAGAANSAALPAPARDRYFMESRTSSADLQTSAALTSTTLNTTNTLTTGSR